MASYTGGVDYGFYGGHSSNRSYDQEHDPDALQSRTLFFGRLSDSVTEQDLRVACETYGDIKKVAVYPEKHMGFVEFFDLRHAEAARDALKGSELGGKKIEVQFSAVKRPDKDGNMGTLYIRPVSASGGTGPVDDPNPLEAYRKLFGSYGDIKKVSVNRKRDCEKFIEYHDLRDSAKALETLNGYDFNGVTLQICFAQNASRSYNKDASTSRPRRAPDNYGPYRGPSYSPGSRGYNASPYAPPGVGNQYPPSYGVCHTYSGQSYNNNNYPPGPNYSSGNTWSNVGSGVGDNTSYMGNNSSKYSSYVSSAPWR